jgi:ribonucleoside-triphosphate reductase (thioredoxin)
MQVRSFKLSDSFLDDYKKRKPEWGPLGEITFLRTYSRKINENTEEERNEEWWEAVKRVVEGTFNIQKEYVQSLKLPWNNEKARKSAQIMYDKIFNFKFLPPGRGLWMMGTDFVKEKGSAGLNNCFRGSEKFITDKGLSSFYDTAGERVKVLDGNKKFVSAEIKNFGKQELNRYVFKPKGLRSSFQFEKQATSNHRWILADGRETENLSIDDEIKSSVSVFDENSKGFIDGFAHGIIFGDGTRHTYYPERHMIRLCSERDKKYQSLLESIDGYISTNDVGGDPYITIVRKNENWKSLPENKSYEYIAGFVKGWIVADARETSQGWKIGSINKEALEWIASYGSSIGWNVTGLSLWDNTTETNYGKRSAPLWGISLTKNDVIYKVREIEYGVATENVYCAVVPTTHSFHLEGGIHTGNCGFISTDDIATRGSFAFTWTMDALMVGVGIGFDTKGAGLIEIKEAKENKHGATQIADSREGWVHSLGLLLDAYFYGKEKPIFDYSLIRPEGEPIRGFGGVASGPGPLKLLHERVDNLLYKRVGDKIKSTDIVDLMNMIGACVVAGNVRRSAEIAFGNPEDVDFVTMKDYNKSPKEVKSHRWASNNSVFAEVGKTDYSKIADSIALNGEPGVIWLENMQKYGRIKDGETWADRNVKGSNPCSEQTLESGELCCLVETFPSRHDTYEEYKETLKYAYLYGKTVTLLPTHWEETNAILMKNRRIGTSQSGIIDAFVKHGRRTMIEWSDNLYGYLRALDKKYSDWLAIPQSIKITSVKPSGSVSLLPGVSAGIHYQHDEYYIRRIRIPSNSPLVEILREAGYEMEYNVYGETKEEKEKTMVVSFPVKEDLFYKRKNDVSIWEQMKNLIDYQTVWADNAVSITVTFKQEEAKDIQTVLEAYEDKLKAVSFLPISEHGYEQAPYESITKEKYEEMSSKIKEADYSKMTSALNALGSKFCDGESCEI